MHQRPATLYVPVMPDTVRAPDSHAVRTAIRMAGASAIVYRPDEADFGLLPTDAGWHLAALSDRAYQLVGRGVVKDDPLGLAVAVGRFLDWAGKLTEPQDRRP